MEEGALRTDSADGLLGLSLGTELAQGSGKLLITSRNTQLLPQPLYLSICIASFNPHRCPEVISLSFHFRDKETEAQMGSCPRS